jgi:protein-tyrosine phosphatase
MLPVLDGSAPGVSQLRAGAEHIARHLPAGSVYVHCARGRERSAAVVIAYLLASRRVSTPAEGLAFLRTRRACTGLTRGQARALERFAKELRRAPIPMA